MNWRQPPLRATQSAIAAVRPQDHTRSVINIVPSSGTQETVMKRSLAIALLAGALVAGGASAAPRTVTDADAPRALQADEIGRAHV